MAQGKPDGRQSGNCAKNTKSKTPQLKGGYCLHVKSGGAEERYEREPTGVDAKPTLHVIVTGRFERTRTKNVTTWNRHRHFNVVKFVRPPGLGWRRSASFVEEHTDEYGPWTEWRRRVASWTK